MSVHSNDQFKVYESDNFTLTILPTLERTTIFMQVLTPIVSTIDLPATYAVLERHLPSVLETECFNDDNLPFSQEVLATEIGHLFEHIILDLSCQEKMTRGCECVEYNGWTNWDWKRFPYGSFKITLDIEGEILRAVLTKAMEILEMILASDRNNFALDLNFNRQPAAVC